MPQTIADVTFTHTLSAEQERVLTPQAVAFVAGLQRRCNARRKELLQARMERQERLDGGERPDFLPETRGIREGEWTVAPLPADLEDRRVEIPGRSIAR